MKEKKKEKILELQVFFFFQLFACFVLFFVAMVSQKCFGKKPKQNTSRQVIKINEAMSK